MDDQMVYFFSKERVDHIKNQLLELCQRDANYSNNLTGRLCVEDLLDIITEYRKDKKWTEADELRDWMKDNGFEVTMYKWGGIWATNIYSQHYKKTQACGWNTLAKE